MVSSGRGKIDYDYTLKIVDIDTQADFTSTENTETIITPTYNAAYNKERDTKKELQIHTSIIDSESTLKIEVSKTPREIAQEFFNMDEKELFDSLSIDPENGKLKEEIRNFRNYWTELALNGKKQRWEKQETFEVKGRLRTWFRNAKVMY